MKVDVIGSNSLLFANLPPASQVPGRTYRVSDVGPAPGILLTSDGTKYRPAGGRQVLAMRASDITIQNLNYQIIETLGPFPGGLIQQGMAIETNSVWRLPAVSTTSRKGQIALANTQQSAASAATALSAVDFATNSMSGGYRGASILSAKNNTNGPHPVGLAYHIPFGIDATAPSLYFLTVDFSAPWYITIIGRSVAETATTITSATWSAGVATFTNTAHTLNTGDKTTVAGVTPSGYNGVYTGITRIDANTWSGTLVSDPGAYTSGGTSSRISNVISQSYVLELVG